MISFAWRIALAMLAIGLGIAAGGAFWLNKQIETTQYCSTCHLIAPFYSSWKSSPFLAHTHAGAGLVCQDCHARTLRDGAEELLSYYITRDYKLPMKEEAVRPEACFRCHGNYAELAQATKDLRGPDGFALGRNPHDSHWGQLECGICHKMHRPSVDLCAGCHMSPATGPAWMKSGAGWPAPASALPPFASSRSG